MNNQISLQDLDLTPTDTRQMSAIKKIVYFAVLAIVGLIAWKFRHRIANFVRKLIDNHAV